MTRDEIKQRIASHPYPDWAWAHLGYTVMKYTRGENDPSIVAAKRYLDEALEAETECKRLTASDLLDTFWAILMKGN